MSRAFLKNETADDPVVIPARSPLPPGVPNYVTSRGLVLLRTELSELETERAHLQAGDRDDSDRTRQLAEVNGRIGALNQRIASAKLVDAHTQPHDEVRFGASVTLRTRQVGTSGTTATDPERQITIVGVDEADAAQGRVAFTAPIARAMQGKRVGDEVALRTGRGEQLMEVIAISYLESDHSSL
ncbi:GreA/GreB family elongation factor [Spirosoma knui]